MTPLVGPSLSLVGPVRCQLSLLTLSSIKVNCTSFAFNVIKQNVDIDEHQKKNRKLLKRGLKLRSGRFVYCLQVMTLSSVD